MKLKTNERNAMVQYLKECAFKNNINGENDSCGQLFAGTIKYASMVFTSHLILGGAYMTNNEDKIKLCDLLKEINQLLDKYEIIEG